MIDIYDLSRVKTSDIIRHVHSDQFADNTGIGFVDERLRMRFTTEKYHDLSQL